MSRIGPDFSAARRDWLYQGNIARSLPVALGLFLILSLVQLGLPVLGQVLVGVMNPAILKNGMTPEVMKTVAVYTFAFIIPVSLLTVWLTRKFSTSAGGDANTALGLHFPKLGWLGWFAIIFGFVFVVGALSAALRGFSGNTEMGDVEKMAAMLRDDPYAKILLPLAVIFFGPIAEEFMFRGFLLGRLRGTVLGALGAAVVSSIIFALFHGATQPPIAMVQLFTMSMALSLLYLRFGSLWVPIICHAVWNGITTLILFNAPLPP
jgi:uncharacterized protein